MEKTVAIQNEQTNPFREMKDAILRWESEMEKLAIELRRPWPEIQNEITRVHTR